MERVRTPQRSGVQAGLKVLAIILGLHGVVFGVWAFFWPKNSFDIDRDLGRRASAHRRSGRPVTPETKEYS